MLHFFNGKYMGYGLKYSTEIMCLRVFKKRLSIQLNIVLNNYQLKKKQTP